MSVVKKRFHWAMRNCNNDANQLRALLDNIPEHYKGNHGNCDAASPCRDAHFQLEYIRIVDPVAETLLKKAIRGTLVYKYPQNYTHALDTYYVESYNNVLNIFQDKRNLLSIGMRTLTEIIQVCGSEMRSCLY